MRNQLLKLFLIFPLLLPAQTDSSDKYIFSHYQTIQKFKSILQLSGKINLPRDTYISFMGEYPSRNGMEINIYRTIYDEINKNKILNSYNKKIQLRYNGPVLSYLRISVINKKGKNPVKVTTVFTDDSPMDGDLSNLLLEKNDLNSKYAITIKDLQKNPDNKRFIRQIKREIYTKLLEDFIISLNMIQSNNKKTPLKDVINSFKNADF